MKSYYHAHETAYQEIKSKGLFGWGNAKSLAELGDEKTNEYLKSVVAQYFPKTSGKKALDVGCGTGTTAFLLAQLGFDVLGVDISETAIQMGRELSSQQNLDIKFVVGDVLDLEKLNQKFDLIYDSHCLHCIVFEEDRGRVLMGIKKSLAPSGLFVLDTMVVPDNQTLVDAFKDLRFDEDFILWHKTKPSTARGIVEINGQHWCAQRRIYPVEKILDEIVTTGFTILSRRLDKEDGKPSMLRLVLS